MYIGREKGSDRNRRGTQGMECAALMQMGVMGMQWLVRGLVEQARFGYWTEK